MYPNDLTERDYWDSLLGNGPGDPDMKRWEYGDNDPSDPEQNWDEEE